MSKGENHIIGRRLVNAYLSSVISISLVLLLVGVASLLLVNARSVSDYFKENMKVSVLMKTDVAEEDALAFRRKIDGMRFIKSSDFVSREQGISEMRSLLGEDFLDVFETSPIPVSIDVTLKADYVSADSLDMVKSEIAASPLVDEVVYQRSLVDALNSNVLINNTVRLNVYARRFTIHTMRLVGATRSFIRAPFVLQAVFQGIFSAIVAIIMLLAIMFVVRNEFAQLFEVFRLDLLLIVLGIVIASGVVICVSSTYFVVNKLVSLKKDELYF